MVSFEQIASLNADVLFLIAHQRKLAERFVANAAQTDWWYAMPAVRNRRIHMLEIAHWPSNGILSHHQKLDDLLRACGAASSLPPAWPK